MSYVRIDTSNVSKGFLLPHQRVSTMKAHFINPFHRKTYERQEVLRQISFAVKRGEWIGIVGRNGSGKSTLLKIIAGIYVPDAGRVITEGVIIPFLELGVGFNGELTARENIFLNGIILGMSRSEVKEKFNAIVAFAELERFLDQKLKNFSSGMQLRLAFSIAIQAEGDIYLLDEVLAVGDFAFQKKSYEQFAKMKQAGKTVLFVSHDAASINALCEKTLWLKNGVIAEFGPSAEVTACYLQSN